MPTIFSSIWPGRIRIAGENLGDVWRHCVVRRADCTAHLVPFHKLSQWLTYSLVEPVEEAGVMITDLDGLTGLAEYRNGGHFVDLGVLTLRKTANSPAEVDSELVVEWRALTVVLLDRTAPLVRERLGVDKQRLPLASLLQGGTWSAGRRAAAGRRADGVRPSRYTAMERYFEGLFDPLLIFAQRGEHMSQVTVLEHPLVQHKLTLMRRKETPTAKFRQLLREISMLLGYEVTRDLPTELEAIETPIQAMRSPVLSGKKLVLISILRAGNGLLEGMLDLIPLARVGHIGIYRDPDTLIAIEYYFKVPDDLGERPVIAVDPMLATAHSSIAAIQRLKDAGARNLKMVCLLAAPEGVKSFHETHPDVPIYTAAIDEKLNDHGYIVPGLGDAGDRLYGTK